MSTPKARPQLLSAQKIVRLDELPQFTGLRRTQIRVLMQAGKFPRPIRLSERRIAWLESEVAAWQAARIAERG
jgi:prophage regulatory protein